MQLPHFGPQRCWISLRAKVRQVQDVFLLWIKSLLCINMPCSLLRFSILNSGTSETGCYRYPIVFSSHPVLDADHVRCHGPSTPATSPCSRPVATQASKIAEEAFWKQHYRQNEWRIWTWAVCHSLIHHSSRDLSPKLLQLVATRSVASPSTRQPSLINTSRQNNALLNSLSSKVSALRSVTIDIHDHARDQDTLDNSVCLERRASPTSDDGDGAFWSKWS